MENKFSFKKVNKRISILMLLLLGVFFFSQIYVMSHVGTKSAEIEQIRIEKDRIRRDNEILTANIDKEKSIASFKGVIERLGLEEKQVNQLDNGLNQDLALLR